MPRNQLLPFVRVLQLQFHVALASGQINFTDADIQGRIPFIPGENHQPAAGSRFLGRQQNQELPFPGNSFSPGQQRILCIPQFTPDPGAVLCPAENSKFLSPAKYRPV